MKTGVYLCVLLVAGLALAGCQTSQSRQAELAAICADPANRQPGASSFDECQAIYPSSDQALQKDYLLGAPSGN